MENNQSHEISPKIDPHAFIYLEDNRGDSRLLRLAEQKSFRWRKIVMPIKNIAEHPFYTLFDVGNNKLTPVDWQYEQQPLDLGQIQQADQTRNNKDIFINQENQKLQAEDIKRMKTQLAPEQLISSIIQNNQQFSKRTDYSKQKYLKKKEKKYIFRFHAEPVTLVNIHRHYYKNQGGDRQPMGQGICGVRWDLYGLMLLHGGPYKRVLIGQQGKGLLIGGVAQRKAEKLTVVGKRKELRQYPIVQQLNLGKEVTGKIQFIDWQALKQQQQKFNTYQKSNQLYDNLMLMGNYNFTDIIQSLAPLLIPGTPITFCCLSLAPLEEAYRYMVKNNYLNVKLWDTWCREYQVLKNRSHPKMMMDSCGGYLLVGYRPPVLKDTNAVAGGEKMEQIAKAQVVVEQQEVNQPEQNKQQKQ